MRKKEVFHCLKLMMRTIANKTRIATTARAIKEDPIAYLSSEFVNGENRMAKKEKSQEKEKAWLSGK